MKRMVEKLIKVVDLIKYVIENEFEEKWFLKREPNSGLM